MLRSSKLYVCIIYAGNVNSLSNNQKQIENENEKKKSTNMKMTCINKNQFN